MSKLLTRGKGLINRCLTLYTCGMNALQFQKKLLGMQENMMNFALMLTANRDDAQDLMQDTTLKVLDNQEKFVDNINFKGWVLTVMRNIFINNYHKIVRTQTVVDQGVDLYNLNVVNDSGFDSPDAAGGFWPHHLGPKDAFHRIYEGGIIVPLLIGMLLMVPEVHHLH